MKDDGINCGGCDRDPWNRSTTWADVAQSAIVGLVLIGLLAVCLWGLTR